MERRWRDRHTIDPEAFSVAIQAAKNPAMTYRVDYRRSIGVADGRPHDQQTSFVSPRGKRQHNPDNRGKDNPPREQGEVSALHPVTCDACADRREAIPCQSRPAMS